MLSIIVTSGIAIGSKRQRFVKALITVQKTKHNRLQHSPCVWHDGPCGCEVVQHCGTAGSLAAYKQRVHAGLRC
jgi:hypothetical protein